MICSYCRVIEIGLEATVTCLNGHFLCRQCAVSGMSNCMLCEAPMFVMNENGWMSLQSAELQNWTPEMIREWSRQTDSAEEPSARPDECSLSADGDEKSLNLLFSKGNNFEAQSPPASEELDVQELKWIQPLVWKSSNNKVEESSTKSKSNYVPSRFIKLGCIESKGQPDVAKKDTRQQLVEQTIEEIRKKVMEEIYKPFKDDPRSRMIPEAHTYAKEFNTIGVSTESAPRLIPEEPKSSSSTTEGAEEVIKMEQFPREFVLLQAETKLVPPPQLSEMLMKKSGTSSVNMKLQQIVGTFVEDKPPAEADDHHFYRLLREKFARVPPTKLAEIISSLHSMGGDKETLPEISETRPSSVQQVPPAKQPSMSNSRRAYYDPPKEDMTAKPQFQIISFSDHKASIELQQTEIIDAGTLNIPRSPVICPISNCQRAFFVSDLTRHIDSDHTKVLKERMLPQQCKNFYLDPKLIQFGISRCQALLTVQNKIKNLGSERFKNLIPIMVMTTKISLLEICSKKYKPESDEVKRCAQHFIMIWLTGITPPQLPIFFSLTVWARSGKMPVCHVVHSGRLYSVRNPQNPEAVRKSGQMLLLSDKQVELLTNNGRHMLELQITVH